MKNCDLNTKIDRSRFRPLFGIVFRGLEALLDDFEVFGKKIKIAFRLLQKLEKVY